MAKSLTGKGSMRNEGLGTDLVLEVHRLGYGLAGGLVWDSARFDLIIPQRLKTPWKPLFSLFQPLALRVSFPKNSSGGRGETRRGTMDRAPIAVTR